MCPREIRNTPFNSYIYKPGYQHPQLTRLGGVLRTPSLFTPSPHDGKLPDITSTPDMSTAQEGAKLPLAPSPPKGNRVTDGPQRN